MTDRFKIALNNIKSLEGRTFSSPDECDTIYAGKLVSYMDEIIEALTLATESEQLRNKVRQLNLACEIHEHTKEQLRKERDDLAVLCADLISKQIELAKKVSVENGNA